jgi:uncharacterized protein (DUF305 family)
LAASAGILLAGLIALTAGQQTPPIFQPGAPGTASRVVTPAEAVALGRSTFTDDDVAFMQHMIVHHAQAVEMVELLRTRGVHPTVRRLGERIALSQDAEIALMRGWLSDRGQPLEMPGMGEPPAAPEMNFSAGDDAPDFKLKDAEGKEVEKADAAHPYIWIPGELQGLTFGLEGMKVGGKRTIKIPKQMNPPVPGLASKRLGSVAVRRVFVARVPRVDS